MALVLFDVQPSLTPLNLANLLPKKLNKIYCKIIEAKKQTFYLVGKLGIDPRYFSITCASENERREQGIFEAYLINMTFYGSIDDLFFMGYKSFTLSLCSTVRGLT